MDAHYYDTVRERFLKMGKKYNWFNKPSLNDKIAELKEEIKSKGRRTNPILTKTKSDFLMEEEDDGNGHTGSNDNDTYANDVQYTCIEIDGEDDSPIARPKRRNARRNNFIEVISISDSPLQTGEVSYTEESCSQGENDDSNNVIEDNIISDGPLQTGEASFIEESHSNGKCDKSNNDIEDISISEGAVKAGEVSYVEESCSYSKNDRSNVIKDISISDSSLQTGEMSYIEESHSHGKSDQSNDDIEDISISDDIEDISISDSAVKAGEVSYVEESCSFTKNDRSNNVMKDISISDGPVKAGEMSKIEESRSHSKSDQSNNLIGDISISDSPVKVGEVSSVEESCSRNSEEYYDNGGDDIGIDDNEYNEDDEDIDVNEDIVYEDFQQEPHCSTPLMVTSDEEDGESESDSLTESTSPKSRNSEGCCDDRDDDIGHNNIEDDCKFNDDDDDSYKDIEEEPHHFTSLLANSDERDGDGKSNASTELTRPKSRNYHSSGNIIEDLSLSDCPVNGDEVASVEKSSSHSNNTVATRTRFLDISAEHSDDGEDYNEESDTDDDCKSNNDVDEDATNQDTEQQLQDFTNSVENDGDGESNSSRECNALKCSTNIYCSRDDEDASPGISNSPLKASLSARLFKKYNPEKSESDVDDFEHFLQKIRTPKQSRLSGEERKREASLNEFIVDDAEEDQEEDVFYDPGYTPELEELSDDDKENDDCIEISTPASSITPFKTPRTISSITPFKTPRSTTSSTPLMSAKSRLLPSNSSCPKSVLDSILSPYSKEKDFKKSKDKLVRDLFELYNRTVFDNQLPSDFQITWNPRMRSTAGFCYYSKKNNIRMARIELADKVIDSADRLRDTLIHEMCHAAAWMISGVKAGHGAVWKKWTLRANFVHQDLPPISRCHGYTINAKYTYRCTNGTCANSFGRHSKSVNLEKSRCAYCHSRLELVPQLKKDGTPQSRTPSRFALFVKQNYARIKSDNDTFSHQEVMKALSSEFAKMSTS